MSHHYHEDDDFVREDDRRKEEAGLKRESLISEQIEALSPEDRERYEQAAALMKEFGESAEGIELMDGAPGWEDYEKDVWKNAHMATELLVLSGALKVLTKNGGPS